MSHTIGFVTVLVRDYDEAIAFFTGCLRFTLIEDSSLGKGKRWVLVAPPGPGQTALLLAKAATPEQESRIGNQTGGRVFLFLHTDDFWAHYHEMRSRGVTFVEEPRREEFGTVAVFLDLYGNKWDLLTSSRSVDHLPTKDGYDRWAEFYDADDNPLVALEEPLMRQLLGDVRGCSIVDIGCGTGRHATWLAAAGANVQAVDFSEAMLARARAKAGTTNITFQVHDLAETLPFSAQAFDRVVCGLVVDHIVDLERFFREIRPMGEAVVSVMHPTMMLRGVQARYRDPVSGREVRPASCAHRLSNYILAAARAGFVFGNLSEHEVDETLASRLPRAGRYLGWPLLFLMRLLPAESSGQRKTKDPCNTS